MKVDDLPGAIPDSQQDAALPCHALPFWLEDASPSSKPRPGNADEWVSSEAPATKEFLQTPLPPAKTGIIKRLTLDLNEDLHRRIKLDCTIRGSTTVEEITKLLEKEFPASQAKPRKDAELRRLQTCCALLESLPGEATHRRAVLPCNLRPPGVELVNAIFLGR